MLRAVTCHKKKKIAGIRRYLLVHVCPSSLSFSCRMLVQTASPFPAHFPTQSAHTGLGTISAEEGLAGCGALYSPQVQSRLSVMNCCIVGHSGQHRAQFVHCRPWHANRQTSCTYESLNMMLDRSSDAGEAQSQIQPWKATQVQQRTSAAAAAGRTLLAHHKRAERDQEGQHSHHQETRARR